MKIPNVEAFKSEYMESRTLQRALIAGGLRKSTATKGKAALPDDLKKWVDEQGKPAALLAPRGEILKPVPPEFLPWQNTAERPANPNGGSREYSFKAGMRKKLERDGIEPVVNKVYGLATGEARFDSDTLRAAEMIRDTIDGKPTQDVNVKGLIVMMPADSLLEAAFGPEPE